MLAWRRAAAHTIMTAMTDIIPQLSLPPCILCSSITGNTRFLADALAGATGAPVFPTGHPPLLDHAGTLLLGFWVRRGLPLPGADAAGELDGGHFFAWSAGTGRLS